MSETLVWKPTHHAQRKEVDEGHASKGGGYAQQAPKVGQGQEATEVFSGFRELILWHWQKLILCSYILSQLNQINFPLKTFRALSSCPLRPYKKGPKPMLSRNHSF